MCSGSLLDAGRQKLHCLDSPGDYVLDLVYRSHTSGAGDIDHPVIANYIANLERFHAQCVVAKKRTIKPIATQRKLEQEGFLLQSPRFRMREKLRYGGSRQVAPTGAAPTGSAAGDRHGKIAAQRCQGGAEISRTRKAFFRPLGKRGKHDSVQFRRNPGIQRTGSRRLACSPAPS